MKTYLCIFDPLKPHFLYSKTGVYRGKHYFFLISAKNIDCGYSLEPPRQKYENFRIFVSENFQFLVVKFSIYLNRDLPGSLTDYFR